MNMRIINTYFTILPSETPKLGGSSAVYRARDARSGQEIALKILSGHEFSPPEVSLFFEREKRALLALKHPNIVRLIDAGQDDQTGEYYLALEWVDTTLSEWVKPEFQDDTGFRFDDFVERVAIPLAEALAFAHERSVVHRDIKPSNVLISGQGVPKLADFGISKIKNALTGGPLTTAQFGSKPYAAPERDGTASYARDVFGFGVLMLSCLTSASLDDYDDIPRALDQLDVIPRLHDLIERCVDPSPETRVQNGMLLYHELEAIQQPRLARAEQQVVHLALKRKALAAVTEATGIADQTKAESFLENDLNDAPSFKVHTPALNSPDGIQERHFFLAGSKLSVQVVPEGQPAREALRRGTSPTDVYRFAVIGAAPLDPGDGDRRRERDFSPEGFKFSFAPALDHNRAYGALRALIHAADADELAREQQREQREEARLFNQWFNQLNAREAIEGGKEARLAYVAVGREGRRATFTIPRLDTHDLVVDEPRRVVEEGESRSRIRGVVEDISGQKVTLYLDAPYDSIPSSGFLIRDTQAARSAISRERDALNAVRHQGPLLVRPDLPRLIIHPDESPPPENETIDDNAWFHSDLDTDKKAAVRAALGSNDFFVVQGPPGTGKTTLIAELIVQELRRNPRARILLTSQTNVALDNALARLGTNAMAGRFVRLARTAGSAKVAPDVQALLLDNQLAAWSAEVRARSTRYIEQRAGELDVKLDDARAVLQLMTLRGVRQAEVTLNYELDNIRSQIQRVSDPLSELEEIPSIATIQDLSDERDRIIDRLSMLARDAARLIKEIEELCPVLRGDLDTCTADDARDWADALLPEDRPGAMRLRELVALQSRWLERLGRSEDFQAPLLAAMNVVAGTCVGVAGFRAVSTIEFDLCILDEASKATATEALVPLVRARRWVLVGDRKQLPPFQEDALRQQAVQGDYDLDPEELKRTLFDRLSLGVPVQCSAMLRTQHRMTTAIGALISESFYDGELINEGPPPYSFGPVLPRPVVWFTTSHLADRYESRVGTDSASSYSNTTEATFVIQLLNRLNFAVKSRQREEKLEVLVLSPYRPQVAELHNRVSAGASEWRNLLVEVNSVDAAQGREADVVVFSVTRSNPKGQLGFLNEEARANVALSRGRRGLAIVGDHAFCASKEGPLRRVFQHVETHRDSCALERAEL